LTGGATTRADRPPGLRLIIAYKVVKSVAQLGAAALLFYGVAHGLAAELTAFADRLREHAVHVWSNAVATALLGIGREPHRITVAAAALAGDAVLSSIEAWVLARGYRWAAFLVAGATASLLPFEIAALVHHLRLGRVLLLAVNAAIVTYLVRRAIIASAAYRACR
jgi:uncharacterized membrane protein (DUF2068 family)